MVDAKTHTLYRSGVAMLLYLVNVSRSKISNAVREAAKVNIGQTKAHMKSFYKLIKFVVDTKNYEMVMEPKQPTENTLWEMMAYCDSDYARDKDERKV